MIYALRITVEVGGNNIHQSLQIGGEFQQPFDASIWKIVDGRWRKVVCHQKLPLESMSAIAGKLR
ncbi:hypothetical protein HYR99_17990 [Candidatus Poribacteria bacterium]|nr:hypothetical protein [Candidatus Poribacteria bacterium]